MKLQTRKKNGYFIAPISDYQMIKPISDKFKKIYPEIKAKKVPWHIALEQTGF